MLILHYITFQPIIDLPDWMKNLKLAFCDESSDIINSKILLLKLIVNCETNFEPYAKHWLGPIMQFVLDKHLGENLNYFIIDVVMYLNICLYIVLISKTYVYLL